MSRFEMALMMAKNREEIINLEPDSREDLTEEQVIRLKAQYSGFCEETIKMMLESRKAIAEMAIIRGTPICCRQIVASY